MSHFLLLNRRFHSRIWDMLFRKWDMSCEKWDTLWPGGQTGIPDAAGKAGQRARAAMMRAYSAPLSFTVRSRVS